MSYTDDVLVKDSGVYVAYYAWVFHMYLNYPDQILPSKGRRLLSHLGGRRLILHLLLYLAFNWIEDSDREVSTL